MRKLLKKLTPNKALRKKLLITAALILVYRLMANIPIPGVDPEAFQNAFGDSPFGNIFSLISGGRLDQPSVMAIGIAPYINASIIIQLLTTVIPKLEELSKEGESGRNKINQYTRLLTLPLAAIQAVMIYTILTNPELTGGTAAANVLNPLNGIELAAFVLTLTAGSMFLMWLGELITENGIGNGASMIITFGIIASLPRLVLSDISGLEADWAEFLAGNIDYLFTDSFLLFYVVIAMIVALTFIIVYFNEAQRKIPVMYARRFRGTTGEGDAESFLPIKLNPAGVIPVIFAQALLTFPTIISSFIVSRDSWEGTDIYNAAQDVANSAFLQFNTIEYVITFFTLTVGFTFFYTYVIVKPEELAKNLQKSGAFIPGIRPGNSTIKYLNNLTARLTLWGSLFLASISVTPIVISVIEGNSTLTILSGIGGTSLLIVVSVFMDTYRKANSLKSVVSYEKYM